INHLVDITRLCRDSVHKGNTQIDSTINWLNITSIENHTPPPGPTSRAFKCPTPSTSSPVAQDTSTSLLPAYPTHSSLGKPQANSPPTSKYAFPPHLPRAPPSSSRPGPPRDPSTRAECPRHSGA